jgi:hypothetical protein
MKLAIVGICLVPVLIVAAAITMNWYLIGAFFVVYGIIAGYAFLGNDSYNTAYAAGHYVAASRGRSFRMWAANRRS